MLREHARPVAFVERLQALEVRAVERTFGADRQADAMQRQRIAVADRRQIAVRRPAGAHVVLGVDLEPADIRLLGQDRRVVLGLQADAGPRRQCLLAPAVFGICGQCRPLVMVMNIAGGRPAAARPLLRAGAAYIACRVPWPPLGVIIVVQVPFGTRLNDAGS